MSGTSLQLVFSVIVNDYDKWTAEHLAAAEAQPDDGDDWVRDQLSEVMRAAGDEFIRLNPDLFRVKEII
jgi:hypothetical protein